MEMYEAQFSTNNWIPDKIKLDTFITGHPENDFNDTLSSHQHSEVPHPDISKDPFLSEFLKYLPASSMPMAGCNLQGIDLNDPHNLITMTVDFAEEAR